MINKDYSELISFGVTGACKGSKPEVNEVGCNNQPTHLQHRTFGGVRNERSIRREWLVKPEAMLVAWCCECYVREGGEDCSYEIQEEEEEVA
jgi:hypothetical protein